MAQASSGKGAAGRIAMRTIALIIGLVGTALALIVDILYALAHVLGQVAGVTNDTAHFFYGLIVVLVGLSGSLLAPILPLVAAVMLIAAAIAFFFIVGWWALIASPLLLIAAALTFSNRRVNLSGAE